MTPTLRTIDALFPADNILAQLCDEQKFFKQHFANFSNIMPYGELCVPVSELLGYSFVVEKAMAAQNRILRNCIAVKANETKLAAVFVLGNVMPDETKKIDVLLLQNKFAALQFKTFYTSNIIISDEKFFHWQLKNIHWHKYKKS